MQTKPTEKSQKTTNEKQHFPFALKTSLVINSVCYFLS